MTWGVDDVDTVVHAVYVPCSSGGSSGNRDTTFALLLHPVHGGSTFVYFTDFVGTTGIIKDTFRSRRLTRINVRNNTDVSVAF